MPGQTRGPCILRKGKRQRSRRLAFLGLGCLRFLEQGEPYHYILISGAQDLGLLRINAGTEG